MIIEVVFEIPAEQAFDYHVPDKLQDMVVAGKRVMAPFGRRKAIGYIIGLKQSSQHKKVKEILSVVDTEPVFSKELLELARWMANYYCCSLGQVLRTMLPASVKKGLSNKEKEYVSLSKEASPEKYAKLEKKAPSQYAILCYLETKKQEGIDRISLKEILDRTGSSRPSIQRLEELGLIIITSERNWRRPSIFQEKTQKKDIVLTEEQATAKKEIIAKLSARQFGVTVLHGVTGSGKTEVYLHVIAEAIRLGKSVIFLVPEIALTAQTVARVVARFGDMVAILHSRLSHGERFDEWSRILHGEASIVIGVRSAIFAPVKNLGLVVVDEEHERTYKQDETPRYNARDVAIVRAKSAHAAVVLGTATPSLETYANAQKNKYDLVELTKRVEEQAMPRVHIVDMRGELQKTKKRMLFSEYLMQSIHNRLEKKEQVLLFLNRRGYSPFIICPSCGKVLTCSDCSLSLVHHRSSESVRCHYCGLQKKVPSTCPECHTKLLFQGIGTEKVETQIAKLFPSARVQRMDFDTTQFKNAHISLLERFGDGKIDILVGTQMIAKGLDFPQVTLVGVIFADIALNLPDFRSSEQTFQLLAQVSGRAGRSQKGGEVIIQTYTPSHYAIKYAALHDFKQFFTREMKFRDYLKYPPCTHFINIIVRSRNNTQAGKVARFLVDRLKKNSVPSLIGPNPATISRLKGLYRWQVIIGCPQVIKVLPVLRKLVKEIEESWKKQVSILIDVDPMTLF